MNIVLLLTFSIRVKIKTTDACLVSMGKGYRCGKRIHLIKLNVICDNQHERLKFFFTCVNSIEIDPIGLSKTNRPITSARKVCRIERGKNPFV